MMLEKLIKNKEEISFIDTHVHTKFWEQKHFSELDKNSVLFSLDTNLIIPENICTENIRTENIRTYGVGNRMILGQGIQPYTHYNKKRFSDYLYLLSMSISNHKIFLLGELGLENGNDIEKYILREQLNLVKEYKVPCIIHTPRKEKKRIFRELYEIIKCDNIPQKLILIDHINQDIINLFYGDFYFGLTIQPLYGKLSLEDAKSICFKNKHLSRKLIINSDYSNLPDRKQPKADVNAVGIFKNYISEDLILSENLTKINAIDFLLGMQNE